MASVDRTAYPRFKRNISVRELHEAYSPSLDEMDWARGLTGTDDHLLSLLVWLMFGVIAVAPALTGLTWQTVAYAVLSLTVIRMLPVAVALTGARLGRPAVLFMGWFGPRGLASVVFGLLALEDLAEPAAKPVITVIAFTVLLSVLAHGLTADPLARRYGPRLTPPP